MHKSSSHSSHGKRPDAGKSYKPKDSARTFNKDSKPFKKNYEDRKPTNETGRPARPGRPFAGRDNNAEGPKRPFDRERKEGFRPDGDRGPRRDNDNRRGDDFKPFGDRPKRTFERRDENGGENTRKPYSDRNKDNTSRPYPKRDAQDGDNDRPRRTFDKPYAKRGDSHDSGERKPYADRKENTDRPYPKRDAQDGDNDRPRRTFDKPYAKRGDSHDSGERKPYADRKENTDRPYPKRDSGDADGADDRPKRAFDKPYARKNEAGADGERPARTFDKNRKTDSRPFRERNGGVKPFSKDKKSADNIAPKRPFTEILNRAFDRTKVDVEGNEIKVEPKKAKRWVDDENDNKKRPFDRNSGPKKKHFHDHSEGRKKRDDDDDDIDEETGEKIAEPGIQMPLNKYIAHCGECSRRDAAELVKQGKVKVNGELVLEPGHKIEHTDKVTLSGKKLTPQKGLVYILLNKPKGFITTNDDPQGRRTVMDLVGNSGVERLFPVGRLDRDTSGLLLITNDGELTQKLCHPAYNVKKVYQVTVDKPVTHADFEKIIDGVELEDGRATVDALSYLEKKNELGLEIHSGKNRIVRRIFESLGYVVEKLDRVMYAGLTKKNLPRSKWRYLDEREVILLKHFKI